MKKYAMEFVGTLLFVFSIFCIIASSSTLGGLAIGLSLTMLVYMGATVSGANYNPAITLGLYLRKKLTATTALWYIVSQLLGAIVAYYLAMQVVNISISPITASSIPVFISEFVFTFTLVSMVLHTAATKASIGNSYFGLAIGLTVATGAIAVWHISGGFFNPAVLIGASLTGVLNIQTFSLILISQITAGALAAWFHLYTVGGEK